MNFIRLACLTLALMLVVYGCNSAPTAQSTRQNNQAPVNWFRADGTINWEAEKEQHKIPTDTIVIHHTADPPGMTWQRLSEIQRERLYVPRFKPTIPDPYIPAETPVQSGHFRESTSKSEDSRLTVTIKEKTEVFYGYHWLIRDNGTAERLLKDNEVAWHSGNWDMNCRSIAICFDNNLVGKKPTKAAMKTCAQLIALYMKKFKIKSIIGHNDVKATACPGEWFKDGGKAELMLLVPNVEPFKDSTSKPVTDDKPSVPEPTLTGVFRSKFIADITYTDNAEVNGGAHITKTWRVENTGTRHWKGLFLQRVDSSGIKSAKLTPIPETAPGEQADWSVEMDMPTQSGSYRAEYKVVDKSGNQLAPGQAPVYILVKVR